MPSPPKEIGRGKRHLIIEGMPERKPRRWWKYLLAVAVAGAAAFLFFICSREPVLEKKQTRPTAARRSVEGPARTAEPARFRPGSATETPVPRFHVRPSRFSAGIWRSVQRMDPELRALRRQLHAHPELANRETRTADLLAGKLGPLGLEVRKGVALTGVVALLKGARPGPTVALLAYMDGAAVKEENPSRHASRVKARSRGRMVPVSHASGHDVEMAVLVGVARVFSSLKSELPGAVKFIFQPAGEGPPPGEQGAARAMIQHGVLGNPKVDVLFSLTAQPALAVGRAGFPVERWWTGITHFTIKVRGRNLDACLKPDSTGCVDPVLSASQLVVSLQTLASKQLSAAGRSTRLTVEQIEAGGRPGTRTGTHAGTHTGARAVTHTGALPLNVTVRGSVRWKYRSSRDRAVSLIQRTVQGTSVSSRAHIQVTFKEGRRTIPSDPRLIEWLLPTLRRALGPRGVHMGSPGIVDNQFARYRRHVPAVQIQLGTHSARLKARRRIGAPTFDVDEECISVGVHILANATVDFLLDRAGTAQAAPTGTAQAAPTGTAQAAPTRTAPRTPTGGAQAAPTGGAAGPSTAAGSPRKPSRPRPDRTSRTARPARAPHPARTAPRP